MQIRVSEIVRQIGAELVGDGAVKICSVSTIDAAGADNITFVTDKKHAKSAIGSGAGAIIVSKQIEGLNKPQLLVENVQAALIEVLKMFAPKLKPAKVGIDPGASVAEDAAIGEGVCVEAYVLIESGAAIGDGSIISSGCRIGQGTTIGKNCRLDSNVIVYHNCILGNNVTIQANSVIGSMGFGYWYIDGAHRFIPHNGNVVVEDFVDIGSCCCIDRAKFGSTVIGAGTKMDNFVQIGHNAVIGKCCLIVGQVGISGSTKIGDGVVFAGQSGTVDNVRIGNGAIVGACSLVINNVEAGKKVWGTPAIDHMEALRICGLSRRLPEMVKQLKQLSSKVEKLEAAKNNSE